MIFLVLLVFKLHFLQMTLVCIYLTKILKCYNLAFKMSLIKSILG